MTLLRRLQDSLVEATRPSKQSTEAGGFLVMLTPEDPLLWINYAVPVSAPFDVEAMVEIFLAADRTPRLEFFVDLWPEVLPLLEAAGFECDKRMPIMVLERSEWKGLEHEHDIRSVEASMFHEFNRVLGQAFGMEGSDEPNLSDPNDDPTYQRIAEGTTLASLALVDGVVVGGGLGIGTREIREIAGIGTRSDFRKQGIASAVIADLLYRFFGLGGEVAWLTPGDDAAMSVYAKLGFRPIAEQVCCSKN